MGQTGMTPDEIAARDAENARLEKQRLTSTFGLGDNATDTEINAASDAYWANKKKTVNVGQARNRRAAEISATNKDIAGGYRTRDQAIKQNYGGYSSDVADTVSKNQGYNPVLGVYQNRNISNNVAGTGGSGTPDYIGGLLNDPASMQTTTTGKTTFTREAQAAIDEYNRSEKEKADRLKAQDEFAARGITDTGTDTGMFTDITADQSSASGQIYGAEVDIANKKNEIADKALQTSLYQAQKQLEFNGDVPTGLTPETEERISAPYSRLQDLTAEMRDQEIALKNQERTRFEMEMDRNITKSENEAQEEQNRLKSMSALNGWAYNSGTYRETRNIIQKTSDSIDYMKTKKATESAFMGEQIGFIQHNYNNKILDYAEQEETAKLQYYDEMVAKINDINNDIAMNDIDKEDAILQAQKTYVESYSKEQDKIAAEIKAASDEANKASNWFESHEEFELPSGKNYEIAADGTATFYWMNKQTGEVETTVQNAILPAGYQGGNLTPQLQAIVSKSGSLSDLKTQLEIGDYSTEDKQSALMMFNQKEGLATGDPQVDELVARYNLAETSSSKDAISKEAVEMGIFEEFNNALEANMATEIDPSSQSILAQTGLSKLAFDYLTQGTPALSRLTSAQRQKYIKEAGDWANKNNIDISTFTAEYEAYANTVKTNIMRNNQAKISANEVSGTLDNLEKAAKEAGLGNVSKWNAAKIFAGQQFNSPEAQVFKGHLEQLRREFASMMAAQAGQLNSDGTIREGRESEYNNIAENIIQNGFSTGNIEGMRDFLMNSQEKIGIVLEESVKAQQDMIWKMFGVEKPAQMQPVAPIPYNYFTAQLAGDPDLSKLNDQEARDLYQEIYGQSPAMLSPPFESAPNTGANSMARDFSAFRTDAPSSNVVYSAKGSPTVNMPGQKNLSDENGQITFNANPSGLKYTKQRAQDLRDLGFVEGVDFVSGGEVADWTGGTYVSFKDVPTAIKAYGKIFRKNLGDSSVFGALGNWVGTTEAENYANQVASLYKSLGFGTLDTSKKVSQLSERELQNLLLAQMSKENNRAFKAYQQTYLS